MIQNWQRRRVALLLGILAAVPSACAELDDGGDRGHATDSPLALADLNRAPLGVAGKPVVETATGAIVADELLVRFHDVLPDDAAGWIARTAGGEVTFVAPLSRYAVVRFADEAAAVTGAATLRASGLVADVARNHVLQGESEGPDGTGIGTSPSFELGVLQWNLYAMGVSPFGVRPRADGVVVAVLDTGVAYEDYQDSHGTYAQAPDLAGVDFAPGWDFVNDDAHPNDDQRHGTHVTGVIAASSGIASLAPGATILPIKVLDSGNSGTELALAEGIRFAADHGAQVINMSLSFPPTYFPSRLLQSAIDHAARKGVIMVAAVGNHDEDIVAYPAAFREVIAVGASDLPAGYRTSGDPSRQWKSVQPRLENAGYSNRSYKVDVVAPGGSIPGDANRDGKPEAILAQTFAPGDPTDFGYYFYAGTSQAAAEVSGLAAAMLATDPELDVFTLRAILGENARRLDSGLLSRKTGRGAVRVDRALAAAEEGREDRDDDRHHGHDEARERFHVNVVVTLHDGARGAVHARARVEVLSADDALPIKHATVYGMFTGAAFGAATAETNHSGVAEFWSLPLEGNQVVAFQADGVARDGCSDYVAFDRPRGFLRIESRSLERLTAFASSLVVENADGNGEGSANGTGIGTSPSYELPTDPAETPITIAYDAGLFAGTRYRPTLLLPNFSWGLATMPMAVAVDEAWFLATFPGAAARRVVSRGTGLGASPLYFDDASFPAGTGGGGGDDGGGGVPVITSLPSVSLLVATFSSGTGVGTSTEGLGLGTSPSRHIVVDRTYTRIDAVLAGDIDRLFAGVFASGAGLGTSPSYTSQGPWAFSLAAFTRLSSLATRYAHFAGSAASTPAAAYGSALGAASMPLAPVAPEADGFGLGVQALP